MRQLHWTEWASADLTAAVVYYRDIDEALAQTMVARVLAAPAPLLERPGIGSPTGRHNTRKWRVRNTPFLLLYRVLRDGSVEILRVHHAAQDWAGE